MAVTEIYVKLAVKFADDPKVRALARFGADGVLARDLYVQMVCYCKEMLSDGDVPDEQIGLLVYPLPADHGKQLANHLASVGLIKELTGCWNVLAFVKRNGTRADVERLSKVRAESGRSGGRKSRKPAGRSNGQATSKQVANQRASTYRDRDSTPSLPSPPSNGAGEGVVNAPSDGDVASLVAELHNIRNDWSRVDIRRALGDPKVAERAWPLVRAAAIAVAKDPETEQPGRLAHGGWWWKQAPHSEVAHRPDWCGQCDEDTRLTLGDSPSRCPDCHPLAMAASS